MKYLFSLIMLSACTFSYSQNLNFKKYSFEWPDSKPDISKMTTSYQHNDLVIINENIKLNVVDRLSQTLTKQCIIKINNLDGLQALTMITLPESFDIAADKHFFQQGIGSKREIPYIYKNKIIYYAARILKPNGDVISIPMESKTGITYWNDLDGKQLEDYAYYFFNKGLEVGDVLEYTYRIQFQGRYGYNLFYFNSDIAKQSSSFEIRYSPVNIDNSTIVYANYDIVNSSNGADSVVQKSSVFDDVKAKKIFIYSYVYKDLPGINYPLNTRCGKTLPHVFVDMNFLSFFGMSNVPLEANIYAERGPKFEWLIGDQNDSLGYQASVYDKQHAAIRKFLTKFPADATDDVFYRSLCDSLNAQKFASAQSMRYSQESQYALTSGEWLNKRKIVEEFNGEVYWELLNEKKKTTYFITVQDKRLGETKFDTRAEYKYEHVFLGVPKGKSTRFVIPRYNGLKYNVDELPFYIEGVNAAVLGVNYNYFNMSNFTHASDYHFLSKVRSFIKTPGSSENENVRVENGMFVINVDSLVIHANIKENLNGQFSTIIRPLYLHDCIDSTVNPIYFKKCTDKPEAQNIKIKCTNKSNTFPFKHSFNCSEDIVLSNSSNVSLAKWFSFTFSANETNELPNFDYYFDFKYSDVYNYMLTFSKSVNIENTKDFIRSVNNKYFEINSNLIKQGENSYLLSLTVKVKQDVLPRSEGQLLLDFVNELQALNNLVLKLN